MADVTVKDKDGITSLHWAAIEGYTEVAVLLIEQGADVNAKNRYGATPLRWAAGEGHTDVVKLLLEQGADVNINVGNKKQPLLFWAIEKGHDDIVGILSTAQQNQKPEESGKQDDIEINREIESKNDQASVNLNKKHYYAGINKSLFYGFLTSAVVGIGSEYGIQHTFGSNNIYGIAAISFVSHLFGLGTQHYMRSSYNDYGKYAIIQPLFTTACTLVANHYVKDNIQAVVIGNLVTSLMQCAYFQYEMSKYDMNENTL